MARIFGCQTGSSRANASSRSTGLPGVRWAAVLVWLVGFLLYQWIVPTAVPAWKAGLQTVFGSLGLPFPLSGTAPWLGASIPSFVVAFGLYSLFGRASIRNERGR